MMLQGFINQGRFTIAALAFAVAGQALATPHHRVVYSEMSPNPDAVACTFPDGSSPVGRPELHCYDPAKFLQAYGIDKLHEAGLTGKGQTIILADSFGSPTLQQDLDFFSDTFKLPRTKIEFIYPNGTFVNPLSNADQLGWAQETTLDLEWAHAVAPDARLVNIVTNNSETTGLTGLPDLFAGIKTATQQYPGSIISMSFGTGEPTFTADDAKNYLKGSFHQILRDATAANITLLASAGDSGSTNMNTDQTSLIGTPNASYPATDPLITAVGGTSLQSGWTWNPQGTATDFWTCKLHPTAACANDFMHAVESSNILETVWKEDWALAAGGGGVSSIFASPHFQAQLSADVQKSANGFRTIPDVSLNAAINGGVDVYTSFVAPDLKVTAPQWQSFGGTSCASPETAGLVALAGQKASDQLGKPSSIGFLNAYLYSVPSTDFNDIVAQPLGVNLQTTIDNNALYFSADLLAALGPTRVPPVAVPGFATTAGYDLATGLGTPKVASFVDDVAQLRITHPVVVP